MGIPILRSDFWDTRTDRIIRNFENDEMLHEDLGDDEVVRVYKGYPTLGVDKFAIFVYRTTSDEDEYAMGGDKVGMTATWAVTLITRHAGEPDMLEQYISTFSANVLRCLMRHNQQLNEDGDVLWTIGTPGTSDAASVRDEENQQWEMEIIPYVLWFELILDGM